MGEAQTRTSTSRELSSSQYNDNLISTISKASSSVSSSTRSSDKSSSSSSPIGTSYLSSALSGGWPTTSSPHGNSTTTTTTTVTTTTTTTTPTSATSSLNLSSLPSSPSSLTSITEQIPFLPLQNDIWASDDKKLSLTPPQNVLSFQKQNNESANSSLSSQELTLLKTHHTTQSKIPHPSMTTTEKRESDVVSSREIRTQDRPILSNERIEDSLSTSPSM